MRGDTRHQKRIGFGDTLANHLVIILLLGLLGAAGGFVLSKKTETRTTASTSILLTPLDGNPFYPSNRGEDLLNMNSEAQALRSDQVAAIAAGKLELNSDGSELLSQLAVNVPVNTQILEVAFTARNANKALSYSQAFAESYLEYRTQKAKQRIDAQVAQLDSEIAANSETLDELSRALDGLGSGAVQEATIRQKMDSLTSQNATLASKRAELTTTPLNPGQVVTPAEVQKTSIVSLRFLIILAGILAGMGLGAVIAFLRLRSDDRIQSALEVRDAGFTVMGILGDLPPSAPTEGVVFEQLTDDEYRRLRVAILAQVNHRPASILIGSASRHSKSPRSVTDLAVSLARSGMETLIIDATTAGLGPSFILGNQYQEGLIDVITRTTTLEESIWTVAPLLRVLGPGMTTPETSDLLTGNEMARIMAFAADRADVILVATDSLQLGTSQALCSAVQYAMIEVDQGLSTINELERASQVLDLLPCTPLGTIFITTSAWTRSTPFRPSIAANRGQLPKAQPMQLPRHHDELGTPPSDGPPDHPDAPGPQDDRSEQEPTVPRRERFDDAVNDDVTVTMPPEQRGPVAVDPLQNPGARRPEPNRRTKRSRRQTIPSGQQTSRTTAEEPAGLPE